MYLAAKIPLPTNIKMCTNVRKFSRDEREFIFLELVNLSEGVAVGVEAIVGVVDAQRAVVVAIDNRVVVDNLVLPVGYLLVVPFALNLESVDPWSGQLVAKLARFAIPESYIYLIEIARLVPGVALQNSLRSVEPSLPHFILQLLGFFEGRWRLMVPNTSGTDVVGSSTIKKEDTATSDIIVVAVDVDTQVQPCRYPLQLVFRCVIVIVGYLIAVAI